MKHYCKRSKMPNYWGSSSFLILIGWIYLVFLLLNASWISMMLGYHWHVSDVRVQWANMFSWSQTSNYLTLLFPLINQMASATDSRISWFISEIWDTWYKYSLNSYLHLTQVEKQDFEDPELFPSVEMW